MKFTKHLYQVVDVEDKLVAEAVAETRELARELKRELENGPLHGQRLRIVKYSAMEYVR